MMRFPLSSGALAVGLAVVLGSCAYDPYYGTSASGVGYWESGGYGYGGSSVSTSVFVSTGNPRWVYDPGCFSYYDTTRRCYYDPVLCAYYPAGHRPTLSGRSHPHGWRHGRTHCPPPARVRDVCVSRDRHGSDTHAHRHHRDASFVSNTHGDPRREWSRGSNSGGSWTSQRTDARSSPSSWIDRRSVERNPWQGNRTSPSAVPPQAAGASMTPIERTTSHTDRRSSNHWSSRMREAAQRSAETNPSVPSPSPRIERSRESHGERRASMPGFERPQPGRGFGGRTRDPGGAPPSHPAPSAAAPSAAESTLPEA